MHTQYWQRNVKNQNKQILAQQPVKKQKAKPEWTTDFVDRSQYKLSESEQIQKKATLQSKHRQQAKTALNQRRRKLEQGILDEETRKIYETALTSKKIDINPPIRKNLSQMIRYEREKKQNEEQEYDDNSLDSNEDDQSSDEDWQEEVKDAQNFIKRFERTKKQDKIERTLQILTNEPQRQMTKKKMAQAKNCKNKKDIKFENCLEGVQEGLAVSQKNRGQQFSKKDQFQSILNQDSVISNIEDTIRFMQEKLFATKKTVEQHSKSFIQQDKQVKIEQDLKKRKRSKETKETKQKDAKKEPNFNKKGHKEQHVIEQMQFTNTQNLENEEPHNFGQNMADISQLRIKLKQEHSQDSNNDDECMNTIRRMKQLMDSRIDVQEPMNKADQVKSVKREANLKQNVRSNNLGGHGLELQSQIKFMQKMQIQSNGKHNDCSEAEVSFTLTNNEESIIGNQRGQGSRLKPDGLQDIYEDQYQKIKQNLFQCLGDSEQPNSESESLNIADKISMWRNQLGQSEEDEQMKTKSVMCSTQPKEYGFMKSHFLKQQEDELDEQDAQMQHQECFNRRNLCQSSKVNVTGRSDYLAKPPTSVITNGSKDRKEMSTMKKMISDISKNVQKIQIMPLKIQSAMASQTSKNQINGFDFRGSINIKKNILSKQ